MSDVVNRMLQLQFTNRLKLDEKLFEKFNAFIELVEQIDQSVDPDDPICDTEGYKNLRQHKKIDAASIIRASLHPELTNAGDLSKDSIEVRIEAGYQDAIDQRIGKYTRLAPPKTRPCPQSARDRCGRRAEPFPEFNGEIARDYYMTCLGGELDYASAHRTNTQDPDGLGPGSVH